MNTTETALMVAGMQLAPWSNQSKTKDATRLEVSVTADDLPAAAEALHGSRWGYLAAITGVERQSQVEVVYHFCSGAAHVTLHVPVARGAAHMPTISGVIPSAALLERELQFTLNMVH